MRRCRGTPASRRITARPAEQRANEWWARRRPMATETERLERETEQTRAQLEQTLGELRARMSPGQLMDQASDYFRNGSGRAYLHNLRDEVVHNPVPIALIGAGIAWLALSGAIGRRSGTARDWG